MEQAQAGGRLTTTMNQAESPRLLMPMPDVQSAPDDRQLAIDQVGIRGLRYPLPVRDRDGVQTTIAQCAAYVALPADPLPQPPPSQPRLPAATERPAGE